MKTIINIFILLSITATIQAQHSLQSNLNKFRADDILIKQQVSYKDPGRIGADVLWDFSQLNIVNGEYELAYSAGRDSVIIGTEHLTRYSYVLSNDSLLLWGFRNPTTQMRNKQPELLLKFPVNYGDSIKNYYYGHGKHGNRLELDDMGTIETSTDAYGMMVLPNQDTLKHVLRTHTLKYIAKDTKPISEEYQLKDTTLYLITLDSIDFRLANDTVVFITETFRWYEQGYRYPVFETVRSWEQHESKRKRYEFLATAFFYPPQEQYYLQDDANLAVLDSLQSENLDPWAGLTYNVFPNPVRTQPLNIEIYLPQSASIRVQVRNTMGTVLIDKNQGNYPVGICNFQLNLQGLQTNNYILDIWLNEKLISETIMKR